MKTTKQWPTISIGLDSDIGQVMTAGGALKVGVEQGVHQGRLADACLPCEKTQPDLYLCTHYILWFNKI